MIAVIGVLVIFALLFMFSSYSRDYYLIGKIFLVFTFMSLYLLHFLKSGQGADVKLSSVSAIILVGFIQSLSFLRYK